MKRAAGRDKEGRRERARGSERERSRTDKLPEERATKERDGKARPKTPEETQPSRPRRRDRTAACRAARLGDLFQFLSLELYKLLARGTFAGLRRAKHNAKTTSPRGGCPRMPQDARRCRRPGSHRCPADALGVVCLLVL